MSLTKYQFRAQFRCTNESCRKTYPLHQVIYSCSSCGELLNVEHDLDSLKKIPAEEWKSTFESRFRSSQFPNASGVWGKKEWVLPEIKEENIITSGEGTTHLYDASRFAKDLGLKSLHVKQCGVSHTGSFKDLGMTVLVSQVNQMIADGVPIKAVACASTGDTSAALASYAAKAGIPAIILLPANKVSTAQLIQPVSNGAIVLALETDFDGCMAVVKELTQEKSIYLANSMNSLRIEGQKSISVEITQQLGWNVPDWVVIPGGNLGNVSALGMGFEMMFELGLIQKLPRIILAQAKNASPLYESFKKGFAEFSPVTAEKTLASAIQIGDPVSVKKAIRVLKKFNGIVEVATEEELANAAAKGDLYGLYNDPHTGVALASLLKSIQSGVVKQGESVVVISTANGLKFTEFKLAFHEGKIPKVDDTLKNVILPCKPTLSGVMEILGKHLKKT
ncbi:threonine synthase [Leptospira levettii]|uniref:Threonine synthase n=1 Tax=Leptospira levettii TaxID=2023178 RepID=A0A2N0AUX1_9LEPT|nr:threonine synthase [Leptospira levettii]PKA22324.1 threonine synthase [Leptospira sp. mixed culture ATI2-C-A1]MCW7474032.1 threonine synthase [Leptospira levettii]MCW7496044.1 threonine synthase [Leptospira levettii]MCW7507582.1 threonine synthase [Leptospira levettii]MCW7509944.1 threonine synthase [Leptospira levettii]